MRLAEETARSFLEYSPAALDRVSRFFAKHGDVLEELASAPAVVRLGGVAQTGMKRIVEGVPNQFVPFCGGMLPTEPADVVTRLEHSVRVCGCAMALAAHRGLSDDLALCVCVAALLHDAGHPPFSHALETVFERFGIAHHEDLGERLLHEDPRVSALLRARRIDASRVAAIMREEGDDGLCQSLSDSLTYVLHDAAVARQRIHDGFARDLLRSIRSVEGAAFVTDDRFLIEQFLHTRASLLDRFHLHAYNRSVDLLTGELCAYLVETGMGIDRLCRGTDAEMLDALSERVGAAPAWVGSARRFVLGKPSVSRTWNVRAFVDEGDARAYAELASRERPRFLLPPIDRSRKALLVREPAQDPVLVLARGHERPAHQHLWHSFSYAGPV